MDFIAKYYFLLVKVNGEIQNNMGVAVIANICDCIKLLHKNHMLGYTVENVSLLFYTL